MSRIVLICFCTFLIIGLLGGPGQTQTITTVAGGWLGDGVPAFNARLRSPNGIAIDVHGNLYIADNTDDRIRRVDGTTGIITTLTGDGTSGFAGDGGSAMGARISSPSGVAVDVYGNLYFVDQKNYRIRRVDMSHGTITTVAGNGSVGFSGDGGPATNARLLSPLGVAVDTHGNIYISASDNHHIRRVDGVTGIITTVAGIGRDGFAGDGTSGFSGDGGPATDVRLSFPHGVAVDTQGNLYIADRMNHRIRRVDGATGIITTVAGDGTYGFSGDGGPAIEAHLASLHDVAVDAQGNLYIADRVNHRIRRVDGGTGIITTVAGDGTYGFSGDGGPATNARLNFPHGVAVDAQGNFYIADEWNRRIRRVNGTTGIITTVAGGWLGDGGPAMEASLDVPSDVVVDAQGNLYIADTHNHCIRRVDGITGIITTVAGDGIRGFSGDGGPATNARFTFTRGVAVDAQGNLYVADEGNNRIRRVDGTTGIITTVAGDGTRGFSGDGGPATEAHLHSPYDVAVDAQGNLYISDNRNLRIRRVDGATGIITTLAGTGMSDFSGDGGPATHAHLNFPRRVAVDIQGNLYFVDRGNHRIRRVDSTTGIITTVAGSYLSDPFPFEDGGLATETRLSTLDGLVVDAQGNLYIVSASNIRRADGTTGIITTVVGGSPPGFLGDTGPAIEARLHSPRGLALDSQGNLYIADSGNHRIRRVVFNPLGVAVLDPFIDPLTSTNRTENKRPTFSWSAAAGAFSYTLQLSDHAAFENPRSWTRLQTLSHTLPIDLEDGTYCVRVIAHGAVGSTTISESGTFTVFSKEPVVRTPDLDGDGVVGFSDFLIFAGAFGASEGDPDYVPAADLNGNGTIDFEDFLIFANAFGQHVASKGLVDFN